MVSEPSNWTKHYKGDEAQNVFKRKYSYSDRCRYYLSNKDVKRSLTVLINNIDSHAVPLNMLG